MIRIIACVALLAATATAPAPATWAQTKAEAEADSKKEECASLTAKLSKDCVSADDLLGKLDLAVPENALFSLMGATPETIIRPKAGDSFSASVLPQVIDTLGNEKYAIAVEINPGLLMTPKWFSAADLAGDTRTLDTPRLLSMFTVSAAASKSTGDSTVSQYGLGLNFNFDSGSPLNNKTGYASCISTQLDGAILSTYRAKALAQAHVAHPDWFENGTTKPLDKHVKDIDDLAVKLQKEELGRDLPSVATVTARCMKEVTRWNRDMVGGGIAVYYSETDPTNSTTLPPPQGLSETGFGAWATWSKKVGDDGQFTVSGRYTDNLVRERKVAATNVSETVDGWRVGARYTHNFSDDAASNDGSQTRAFRGFVEMAYTEEKFSGIDDKFTQAGIGLEVQVSKDLYFQAVIGDTFDSAIDRDAYLSGQLKWSFSGAPAK